MKKLLFLLVLCLFYKAQSQVTNASQLLKIHNITNTSNLNNISNPTSGNIAYLNSDKKIYKYDGSNWAVIGGSGELTDGDEDTYIQVDDGNDNDVVAITITNTHTFNLKQSKIDFINSDGCVNIVSSGNNASALNVFIGHNSGIYNTSGDRNTAIGSRSLRYNTSGSRNVAVGNKALVVNQTGKLNTAIGSYALYSNDSDYNTAIGSNALESNTKGEKNTAVGSYALGSLSHYLTARKNTALGYKALEDLTKGKNNIGIGYGANIGSQLDNTVRIGNEDIQHASIEIAWSYSSDSIWKRDIRPLKYGLDLINKMEPVDYIRKTNDGTKEKGREMGFIAQNLVKNLEDVGYKNQGFVNKERGHYSVRYNDFIPLAIKGIQEQQKLIDELKQEITQLKNEISDIKSQISK